MLHNGPVNRPHTSTRWRLERSLHEREPHRWREGLLSTAIATGWSTKSDQATPECALMLGAMRFSVRQKLASDGCHLLSAQAQFAPTAIPSSLETHVILFHLAR